ncbi:MAG: fructosamine kinase family protein [Pseudomonadota bacterium]
MTLDTYPNLADRVEQALGRRPTSARPLSGGSTVEVLTLDLPGGERVVVKWGPGRLTIEAAMLKALADQGSLPLPNVLSAAEDLLILEFIASDNDTKGGLATPGPKAQIHAAELLAGLHATPFERFGFEIDTLIGKLDQPNPWADDWVDFFREHRLLYMARASEREGTLPAGMLARLEKLGDRLEDLITRPPHPALLHGDVWTGNLLVKGDRIAAFIDPAVYYGDREMDLAFATLFGTVGKPFFDRYQEIAPLEPGFFEIRRDLYNIYPLLVHVRYWDVSYADGIDRTLRKLGI